MPSRSILKLVQSFLWGGGGGGGGGAVCLNKNWSTHEVKLCWLIFIPRYLPSRPTNEKNKAPTCQLHTIAICLCVVVYSDEGYSMVAKMSGLYSFYSLDSRVNI